MFPLTFYPVLSHLSAQLRFAAKLLKAKKRAGTHNFITTLKQKNKKKIELKNKNIIEKNMKRTHKEKIDILIKFLKSKPKKEDLVPKKKDCLYFDSKDSYKKYRVLDRHIKLVAKCLFEGIITFDDFFSSFEKIRVKVGVYGYDINLRTRIYVLFPNSAEMMLYSSLKNKEVGKSFFNNFYFENFWGVEVDINHFVKNQIGGGRDFDLVCN